MKKCNTDFQRVKNIDIQMTEYWVYLYPFYLFIQLIFVERRRENYKVLCLMNKSIKLLLLKQGTCLKHT